MNWQDQLRDIVRRKYHVHPTFEQWLEENGYHDLVREIGRGSLDLQARAMRSLYDYYRHITRDRR